MSWLTLRASCALAKPRQNDIGSNITNQLLNQHGLTYTGTAEEYVITTPDTPLPWINYLGSQDFFSLISNTCGGYSFYKDAKLLRITRYRYNNIPVDSNGKYYYIHDGEEIWNPGSMPSKTPLDSYECHHGIGYSRFLSSKNGLKADLLAFVPVNTTCEINLNLSLSLQI